MKAQPSKQIKNKKEYIKGYKEKGKESKSWPGLPSFLSSRFSFFYCFVVAVFFSCAKKKTKSSRAISRKRRKKRKRIVPPLTPLGPNTRKKGGWMMIRSWRVCLAVPLFPVFLIPQENNFAQQKNGSSS